VTTGATDRPKTPGPQSEIGGGTGGEIGGGPGGIAWRPFAAVIVCLMVFDVTIGLSYPLLSLLLEDRGRCSPCCSRTAASARWSSA
jgi:hypothetical protein